MADENTMYTKMVEYCEATENVKGKFVAELMWDAISKRPKAKGVDKMLVTNVSDNCMSTVHLKIPYNLTKESCKKFERIFAKKFLERIGKKPSDADVDAEVEKLRGNVAACTKAKRESKISSTGGVKKMTDTSQYTGAHKQRFDESGKGKGIKGREDQAENSGYVGQYKGQDTYQAK